VGRSRALHGEPFRSQCGRGSRAERISPIMECFRFCGGATLSRRVSVSRRFEGPWQQLQVQSSTEQINDFFFDIDISKSKTSTRIICHDSLCTCPVVTLDVYSHANISPYGRSPVTGFLAPSAFAEFLWFIPCLFPSHRSAALTFHVCRQVPPHPPRSLSPQLVIEWTSSLTGLGAADHLSGTDVARRPHVRLSGRDSAGVLQAWLAVCLSVCDRAAAAAEYRIAQTAVLLSCFRNVIL